MPNLEIRPHHQEELPYKPDEAVSRIQKALDDPEKSIVGSISRHHITLRLPAEEQHFWTPELSLDLEEDGEGTFLRGLCGPRPSVWLMFIFFYFVLGAAIIIIAIVGFSQKNLGLSASILWLLPILAGITIAIYLSARTGQKLSQDQMVKLRDFLETALDHEVR